MCISMYVRTYVRAYVRMYYMQEDHAQRYVHTQPRTQCTHALHPLHSPLVTQPILSQSITCPLLWPLAAAASIPNTTACRMCETKSQHIHTRTQERVSDRPFMFHRSTDSSRDSECVCWSSDHEGALSIERFKLSFSAYDSSQSSYVHTYVQHLLHCCNETISLTDLMTDTCNK